MDSFISFIMSIIRYITDLVAYFRARNDGDENAEQPSFPI